MDKPPRVLKVGSILSSLLLAVGLVFCVGSVLLPSTKRSRMTPADFERMRQRELLWAEEEQAATRRSATTVPAPASAPAAPQP